MINACGKCGAHRADKLIDEDGLRAVCPECGHGKPCLRLPVLAIGGTSGAGESAVASILTRRLTDVVMREADPLWRKELDTPTK
jgi:hypothetical protein